MKKQHILSGVAAVVFGLVSIFAGASPASASTQTVGFQAGSWHCPNGVYGIDHVEVSATGTAAPNISGSWTGPVNTQKANVSITGVPSGGGQAYVVVTYHCKVWTIFGWQPGNGEPANGTRWVYGSGSQPTYTL